MSFPVARAVLSLIQPKRVFARLALVALVFAGEFTKAFAAEDEFKRPSIEAAQRAIQERYLAWTATVRANGDSLEEFPAKIVWPALSDGTSPGDYPKDCFYDKELFDKDTGEVNYTLLCFLIADLANKLTYLPGEYFVSPSYYGRLNGLPGFPTLPAPIYPGTRVNPDNYAQFFEIVCNEIKNRNYPIVSLYSTGSEDVINAGAISKNGYGSITGEGFMSCSNATSSILSDWTSYPDESYEGAIPERIERIEYDGSRWNATFGNVRGRFGFDHSEFGKLGGTAEVFLNLLDSYEWRYGTPSNVPLTVDNAPLQKYKELSRLASLSLSSGSKYFTPEYPTGPVTFASPCPEGVATNGFGYLVLVDVVAAPNFKYNVDSLTAECERCKSCKDGNCPAGGSTSAEAGSLGYTVPLGSSLDGSAGSISLYTPTSSFLMASPLGLAITTAEGSSVITDPSYEDMPRQIVVPQGLVDITVESPFKRYLMRFYDKANQGPKAGRYYQPASGSEYKTISVENPQLNNPIITGTIDLTTSNQIIRSPGHGLTVGAVYVRRIDAVSGALPEAWTIGRMNRKNLYFIAAINTSSLIFVYKNTSGQWVSDYIKDAVPGQTLKFSWVAPYDNLVITETTSSTNRTFDYTYSVPNTGVTLAKLVEINGTRSRTKSVSTTTVDPTHLTEVSWEQDSNGNVITKTQRKYQVFPWNFSWSNSKRERQTLVEETLDPDGAALKTTYIYNEDAANYGPNYSRLVEVSRANGSWERYEYDWDGRAIKTYAPFRDALPSSDPIACRMIEQSSAEGTTIPDQDGDGIPEVLRSTVEKILGNEVARSYEITWSFTDAKNRRRVSNIRCLETGAVWDAAANVRSESWTYAAGEFDGKPAKQLDEAGVLTVYTYATDATNGAQTSVTKVGVPTADGDDVSSGTKTVTVTNSAGVVVDTTTSDIESGVVLSRQSTPAQYIDSFGRTTRVNYLDGTFTTTIYEDCCGAITTIDRDGTSTRNEEDTGGVLTKVTRGGIVERYEEGYATSGTVGFTRSTFRKGRGDLPEVLTRVETFDPAGRLVATRDPRDNIERITRFAEGRDADGHWSRTTTAPDTSSQTMIFCRDGSVKEEQQSGTARTRFEYSVESSTHDGKTFFARATKQIKVGDDESEVEWTKRFTDPLGRSYRTEWPDSAGQASGIVALSFFDAAGHLVKQVDGDGVITLFSQDVLGNIRTRALDINRNGVIDFPGPDRVTRTRVTVVSLPNRGDVIQTTTEAWETAGTDQASAITVAEQSTDGLDSWTTNYGLTTHIRQTFSGGGVIQTVSEAPDQTVQTISVQRGVTLTQKTSHPSFGTLAETTTTVDGLDRPETSSDSLTGAKTTMTYYDSDLVHTQEVRESAAGSVQKTEFFYDNMNRRKTTVFPDNARSEVRYFPGGNVKARFGANTLPVEYTYDRRDRVRTLTTWQHFNDANEAGISGAAVTTWLYDARGQLRQKRDDSGFGPKYTYTAAGRMRTRESARMGADGSSPILTTYCYGSGGVSDTNVESGDVMGIYYSNDPATAPKVENRYDRSGRLETVADASGKRQLTYENGALDVETYLTDVQITPNLFGGYVLDRNFDSLQRYGGIGIKNSSAAEIYRVDYQNDAASRLQTASFAGKTVTYAYSPATTTRISMSYSSGAQPFLSVAQNYDGLNRLTSRVSTAGNATRSVTYEFDSLNRRKKATRENGTYWGYGYDARGQLNSAVKIDGSGNAPGGTFGYTFDDIGNRMTSTNDTEITSYTANLLNQYTGSAPPLLVDVAGAADPAAAITVDGEPVTTRVGRDFSTKIDVRSDNSGPARWRTIEITGVLAGGGVNGANRTATETREVFVPQTPGVLRYDADGNLTDDELWHYFWDAENRLVALENPAGLVAPITGDLRTDRQRLEFSYDSAGRRIAKKVYTWNSATAQWTLSSSLLFLYDGWNLLFEIDQLAAGNVLRSYAWGSDLSGSLQGAGGVGGLLFVSTPMNTYASIYDGNSNVIGLADTSSGSIATELEYDPFGNRTGGSGPSICPFGWSTKYTDVETASVYYALRYYDPEKGRWLNRDLAEEAGGLNLYGFVENAPTEWIDPFGLALYAFDGTNNDGYRDNPKKHETNVFILFQVYKGNKSYKPGVGTNDGLLNPLGLAFGYGGQAREQDMLEAAKKYIKKHDLFADIVGFSRGAAQARDFGNRLKQKYPCVKIRWMGLFDTVASEGLPNDVNIGYQLGIPEGAGSVLHLTAGAERRRNTFALSSLNVGHGIPNPNPNYREEELPGAVHSDVGGYYGDNRGLANQALQRMWYDGRAHDVPFGPLPVRYTTVKPNGPNDSRWINDKAIEALTGEPRIRKVYYHP